ncbi:MAG: pyridoxamine 5'-phosphate oxidase [Sorangiineae bacterium]|nr:pyridoxamine 5'-phosphate oxidase [Polyangiaceae bacterium]MEB2321569.1 pyridoxamine 5'-phosphate oxidase [Sorangiineae bacterium]
MQRRLELHDDPLDTLSAWYEAAERARVPFADAMSLATATSDGRPSLRYVLYKGVDARGVRFFTNYESRKGRELAANPWAALGFFWSPLYCQVRVEGRAERLPAEESDAYYRTRERLSQLGAWASPQSRPIGSRAELDRLTAEVTERFEGREVPRPPHWGGFVVIPERFEFWVGQEHRLHDRHVFSRRGAAWERSRLAP